MDPDANFSDDGDDHSPIPFELIPLGCDQCCRMFKSWRHLENHRNAHRTGHIMHWCIPQCGTSYTSRVELQSHQTHCREIQAMRYFNPAFALPPIAASPRPTLSGLHPPTPIAAAPRPTRSAPHPPAPTVSPNHRTPTSAHRQTAEAEARGSGSRRTVSVTVAEEREDSPAKPKQPTVRYWPKCDFCPRRFRSKALLSEHDAAHKAGTLVCCPTPGCGSAYATPREVKVHQKTNSCGVADEVGEPAQAAGVQAADVRRSTRAAEGSTTRPRRDDAGIVKALWPCEGTRVLQDWQTQALEKSYRKRGYPEQDEIYRLGREIGIPIDVIRRWFSTRRMQGV